MGVFSLSQGLRITMNVNGAQSSPRLAPPTLEEDLKQLKDEIDRAYGSLNCRESLLLQGAWGRGGGVGTLRACMHVCSGRRKGKRLQSRWDHHPDASSLLQHRGQGPVAKMIVWLDSIRNFRLFLCKC